MTDSNLQFLDNGSLVLGYQRYSDNYEIDAELRATAMYLRNFGGSSQAVQVWPRHSR